MKSLHKQLLALLLSLLMVVSMGILPVAADQAAETTAAEVVEDAAPVASEKAKAMVAKWADLGVISADTDPLAKVTRGQFAKMLGDLLGVSGVAAAVEITDVDASIAGAVRAARDLGFFEAVDGKFNPDGTVSVSEALKVMAVLIGYPADLVSNNGGSLALQARLCKGVDVNHAAEATWENVLQLMENVAKEDIIRVIGITGGKAFSAEPAEDSTILTEYLRVYTVTGTIVATPTGAIDGGKKSTGIRIDGVTYADKAGLANKIGYVVKAWYEVDKNDKGTILYAEPANKDYKYYTFNDADILAETTTETIHYYNAEEEEDDELSIAGAIFVYNGAVLANPEDADLKPITGKVEVLDNDGDEIGDVVYITSSVAYVVADVNASARYLSDKYDESKSIIFKDSCELTVLRRGEVATLADIKTNNVVYVGMSKDGKTAVIDIYAVQQRGTLTGFDDEYMYIDGAPYKIAGDNEAEMRALELGAKYTFYLGIGEAVVGASLQVSSDEYGYLTAAGYKTDGLSSYGIFRIFSATYGMANYRTGKTVFVNGVAKTAALAVEAVMDGGSVEAQAVMFRTNEDGELTHLQLAYETPSSQLYNEAVFSKDVVLQNATVKLPGLIDSKVMFSGDMVTIQVPRDASGNIIEDGIAVVPFNKLNLDYATYSGICYDVTADRNVKLFIWERVGAASATLESEDPFIVSRVYKKLNKDGAVATFVEGMRAGASFSVEVATGDDYNGPAISTIKSGDVLWVSIDTMNRLVAAKHAFSLADRGVAPLYKEQFGYTAYDTNVDNPAVLSAVADTNIMGVHNSLAHCKPTRVMGSNLLIEFSDNVPASLIGPTGSPICYVYDEETGKLRTGSLAADVMPYDSNQTLLVWMYSGRYTRTIVVNHKAPKEYTSWLYEPFTTAGIGEDGMPGHSVSSETWSSEAPLNYAIVNEGGERGRVLNITQSGASNEAIQIVTTATTAEKLKSSYNYTLKFRLKVDSITGGGDVSIKLGGAGKSGVSVTGAGNLCLENGWGRQDIMALTMGEWYEIVMQVSKSSATATATAVFVNGERKITHTANDGDWAFNAADKGYFNIQAQDFGGMIPMDYDISLDDITITYPNMPEEINADGETPNFSDLIIPNYLARDEFNDVVISAGSPSNGDGSNVTWTGAGETFSVSADPGEAGDKILNVSNSSIASHWATGWKLASSDLNSGASATGYTLEFKMAVNSNTGAHAWGPRPMFLMFGNGWLAFNNVGGRMYFGFSGENADWGTSIVEGPAASKGIAYEAIGNLAANGWYTVTIHVDGAGLVDISITDGNETISITDKTVNAGSTPTPQKNGYYLGCQHGINSGATNPWTVSFDYIAMSVED